MATLPHAVLSVALRFSSRAEAGSSVRQASFRPACGLKWRSRRQTRMPRKLWAYYIGGNALPAHRVDPIGIDKDPGSQTSRISMKTPSRATSGPRTIYELVCRVWNDSEHKRDVLVFKDIRLFARA